MPNSNMTISDADARIAALEAKLADTVDLLHLWKNETFAYRHLIEAVLTGRFSFDEAKRALTKNYCLIGSEREFDLLRPPLLIEEREAFLAAADAAGLSPQEFLWCCVDSMMNSRDDVDTMRGCREAVERRFREGEMPEWGSE